MIPSIGRIVEYTLSDSDAAQINRRRADASANIKAGTVGKTGFALHIGNGVLEGEKYPLLITRVWGDRPSSAVNGQVMLDGNDTLWVTSVAQGEGPFHWREFKRV